MKDTGGKNASYLYSFHTLVTLESHVILTVRISQSRNQSMSPDGLCLFIPNQKAKSYARQTNLYTRIR